MLELIRKCIEQSPWDEEISAQEKWFNRFAIIVIIFAVLYFVPVCVRLLTEAP